MEGKQADFK